MYKPVAYLAAPALAVSFSVPALAASFTAAGVSFDSDLAVTEGIIIEDGSGGDGLSTFLNGFPASNTVGSLFIPGNPNNRSVELGDDLGNRHRDTIQLGWGGKIVGDFAGWDFAIFENGLRTPEPFQVSVRDVQTGLFSDFLYQPEEANVFDQEALVYVTLFDLSSFDVDFIDAIQIVNILPGDLAVTDARFNADEEDWDADITMWRRLTSPTYPIQPLRQNLVLFLDSVFWAWAGC